MQLVLKEAEAAYEADEVPVGAVVVLQNKGTHPPFFCWVVLPNKLPNQ